MDPEALFDALFVAGLVALGVLNVVRWASARSRDASWNESRPMPGRPRTQRSGGWPMAVQCLVVAALAALVLLRYFGVWPKG